MRMRTTWMSVIVVAVAALSFGAAPASACPDADGAQTCNDDPFPIDCSQAGPYYVNFIIRTDAPGISSARVFDTPPGPCPGLTRLPDDTDVEPDGPGRVSNPDGTKTAVPAGHHVYRVSWR